MEAQIGAKNRHAENHIATLDERPSFGEMRQYRVIGHARPMALAKALMEHRCFNVRVRKLGKSLTITVGECEALQQVMISGPHAEESYLRFSTEEQPSVGGDSPANKS